MAKNARDETPQQRPREWEKSYRDLFNRISDLIMIHDLEGRLINVNPAVKKMGSGLDQ